MRRLFFRPWLAILAFFLFVSCSEKQDFDQFDNLEITPTVASSIFYLEAEESHINQVGTVANFYAQTVNFEAFNEDYVAERLLEGKFIYEIENTTSKQLNFTIDFLDESGNVLDTQVFDIEPAPAEKQTVEVGYGPEGKSLDILTNTTTLQITGSNQGDATSVSTLSEPKLKFKSAGEFKFRLK